MLSIVKKTISSVMIISLLITNILTLTNSKIHDVLYSALSALQLPHLTANSPTTEKLKLKKQITKNKIAINKSKNVTAKISKRITRNASINLASMPLESVPLIGIASIVSVTTMDLYDACETMKDLDELSMLMDDASIAGDRMKVCGSKVPTTNELMASLERQYDDFTNALGGTIYHAFN